MKRTSLPLLFAWLLSCGPADDVGTSGSGSTGGPAEASSPGSTAPAGEGPVSASTRVAQGQRLRVVFLGTSLTAGLGIDRPRDRFTEQIQALADSAGIAVEMMNAGVSGDTSAGGLRRVDWVLGEPADVLVVELGANDGLRGLPVESLRENLTGVISEARRRSPGIRIVLAGMEAPPNMGPRYTDAFRNVFRDLSEEQDAALVPFLLEGVAGVRNLNQSDGIHPNEEGHLRIAHTIWLELEPVLRAVLAKQRMAP